jgi:hypothetical protein
VAANAGLSGSEAFVVVELDIADGAEELVDRLVEHVWRFDAADARHR